MSELPLTPPIPRLRLHLLGEMRATLDGEPLPGKAYAKLLGLLAYLAVEGNHGHSRERLSDLFWPDLSPEAARNNLRQTIYNVRRALGDTAATFIAADRNTVRFHSKSPHWLDLRDLSASTSDCPSMPSREDCRQCLADMEARVALYRGEFLAGLDLEDAQPFQEWRDGWRESLHQQALALLEHIRRCHEMRGALDRAVNYALRYTELEPWDEEGHRQVMRLLALNGQRGSALAQYEACRVMLQEQLDIAPEPKTVELAQRIREGVIEPIPLPSGPDNSVVAPLTPITDSERRQVTVLYCCFSVPGEEDPDEVAECLHLPHQDAITIIRNQGAHIAPTHGGTILAYFGYPCASEDTARRAVRAGIALKKLNGNGVTLVIGIHTGIILADNEHSLPDKVGVASKVAMRLCESAAPGDLVISHATQRLVAGYFHVTARGQQPLAETAKPILTFRVSGETGATGRLDAASRLSPLVARRAELERLKAIWTETCRGRPHRVVLRGEAGIGKSRLLRAFRDSLGGASWSIREMHCFSEFSQSPFYPVTALLERLLAFGVDETPGTRREILDAYLRAYHVTLRDEAFPLIASLLGIAEAPLGMLPQRQRELTTSAILQLLVDVARQQPLLLAVEDVHWADPSTLTLLEMAAKLGGNVPFLTIYTMRPGFAPAWLLESSVVLDLNPLSDAEITSLVHKVEVDLSTETVRRIVGRADGVPLFAEELACMAREAAHASDIPSTLHYLLTARLDAMPEARRTAQMAATIGRTFDRELLQKVAEDDGRVIDRALRTLEEARLIGAEGESGYSFRFRHALIQEAAYESQTKKGRQTAHLRVAEALTVHFPGRVAHQPEQVARHYTAAALPADAVPWWLAAGRMAMRAFAHAEAADHLQAGRALIDQLPPGQERDSLELNLLLPLGQALLRLCGYGSAEAAAIFDRAKPLAEGGSPSQRFEAMWGAWIGTSSRRQSNFDESGRLVAKLLAIAEEAANHVQLSYARSTAAHVALWQGNFADACHHAEAAIASYAKVQGPDRPEGLNPCVTSYAYLSLARFARGLVSEALAASEQAIGMARRLEQPDVLGFALVHKAILHRLLRDVPMVEELCQEALTLSRQYGLPMWLGAGTMMQGWAQVQCGNADGIELLRSSADRLRKAMRGILPAFLQPLADAYDCLGEAEAQLAVAEEALQISTRLHQCLYLADLHRLKGQALVHLGRKNEAIKSLHEALRISGEQGALAFRLRATVALAKVLQVDGEHAQAATLLQEILADWDSAEETIDSAAARALLEAVRAGDKQSHPSYP